MSAFTDAIATRTVRPAVVGGVPVEPHRPRHRVLAPEARVYLERLQRARTTPESELERRAAWGDR